MLNAEFRCWGIRKGSVGLLWYGDFVILQPTVGLRHFHLKSLGPPYGTMQTVYIAGCCSRLVKQLRVYQNGCFLSCWYYWTYMIHIPSYVFIINGRFFIHFIMYDSSTIWTTYFRQKFVIACLVYDSRLHEIVYIFLKPVSSDTINHSQHTICKDWKVSMWLLISTPGTMWTTWFEKESIITDLLLDPVCSWNCVLKIVYFFHVWSLKPYDIVVLRVLPGAKMVSS